MHKTCFGSIVSAFMIILFSLICYVYGKEIIEKKKPIVVSNDRFVRNPQRMDFDRVQQTIMMGFRHFKGFQFYDPSIYQVSAQLFVMQKHYNSTQQKNSTTFEARELKIRQCTINDIQVDQLKGFFSSLELSSLLCFDDNQEVYIEGDISGDYYTRVEVYFKQCQNSTQPGSIVCASQEQLDYFLKITHFVAYIIDKLVDPTQLEKPFEYQGINLYSQSSNKQSKEVTAFFSNYYIKSDLGLINEDIQEVRDFIYSGMQETTSFEDPQIITKLIIRPVKNRETVLLRRYMKISDLVAQLGGLLKLIAIIGSIITIPFAKFHLNKEIINNMFDFKFDERNQFQDINKDIIEKNLIHNKLSSNYYVGNNKYQLQHQKNKVKQQVEFSNNQNNITITNTMPFDSKQIRLLQQKHKIYQDNTKNTLNQQIIKEKPNKNIQDQKSSILQTINQLNDHQKQFPNQPDNQYQGPISSKTTEREQILNTYDSQKQPLEYSIQKILNLEQSISQWAQEKITPIRKLINYNIIEQFQHILLPFSRKIRRQKPFIDLSIKRIKQHLDIQYMLNKFQEVDKLKQILLTEDQIKLFELIPRPIVQRDPQTNEVIINSKYYKQEKSYDDKYQDAQLSLQNILNKDKKSQRDMKLIELLDPNLLSFVEPDQESGHNVIQFNRNQYLNSDIGKLNDEVKEVFENTFNESAQKNSQIQYDYNTNINNTKIENDNDEDEHISENKLKLFMKYNKNSLNI